MLHWSCIPLHVPCSRLHHLRTNKTPKHGPQPRPLGPIVIYCSPYSVSSEASRGGNLMAAKDFAFIDRKKERRTLWLQYYLLLSPTSTLYLSLWKVGSREGCVSRSQVKDYTVFLSGLCVYMYVSESNTFTMTMIGEVNRMRSNFITAE